MATEEFQALCLDTLVAGSVQAYVDLIYLACDGTTKPSQLQTIRRKLMEAEAARRRGDLNTVISCYDFLSRLFAETGNVKTSIYFLERMLDIAKSTGNGKAEMQAVEQLGEAYESTGDMAKSVTYYESHKALAASMADEEELSIASQQLVHVFMKQGEEVEAKGDLHAALKLYVSAVDCALLSKDYEMQVQTLYNAGRVQVLLGNADEGIKQLQKHLGIVLEHPEMVIHLNRAYAALAAAQMCAKDWEAAKSSLKKILEHETTAEENLLAEVHENLGSIFANQLNSERALKHLDMALKLRTKLLEAGTGERMAYDKLRITMGIVKANSVLHSHLQSVLLPSPAQLLTWKSAGMPILS